MPEIRLYAKPSENMSDVADGFVDMVMTSPPEWRFVWVDGPVMAFPHDIFRECLRVLNERGVLVLNVGVPLIEGRIFDELRPHMDQAGLQALCAEYPIHYVQELVKLGFIYRGLFGAFPTVTSQYFTGDWETQNYFINAIDHYWIFTKSNSWKFNKENPMPNIRQIEMRGQRSIFERNMVKFFLDVFTDEGDWVLDPMAAIGTLAEVARLFNRNTILYEIQEPVVEAAEKHLGIKRTA